MNKFGLNTSIGLDQNLSNISTIGQSRLIDLVNSNLFENNKIKNEYMPDLSIITVQTVNTIDDLGSLTNGVQTGDSVRILNTGQFFIYTGSEFVEIYTGQLLSNLMDVHIDNITTGDILMYNADIGKYINTNQLNLHLIDNTIHYSQNQIDHNLIANTGINDHNMIDSHIGNNIIHIANPLQSVGDIYYYSNNGYDRLPIGLNNEILSANTFANNKLEWKAPSWGEINVLGTNAISGHTINAQKNESVLNTKNLIQGNNIDITSTNDTITINALIDTNVNNHLLDNTIHYTKNSISHNDIQDIGQNTHSQIDSHINNSSIHYTKNSISHNDILDIGQNTHSQIDSHINNASIHEINTLSTNGNGVSINSPKVGNVLYTKTLTAGTNVAFTDSQNNITIHSTSSSGFDPSTANPIVIGTNTNVNSSNNAICIGFNATMPQHSSSSICIGDNAKINNNNPSIYAVCIGPGSQINPSNSGNYTMSVGPLCVADGEGATSMGLSSYASRSCMSFGSQCKAKSNDNTTSNYLSSIGSGIGGGYTSTTNNKFNLMCGNQILNVNQITSNIRNVVYIGNYIHCDEIGAVNNAIVINTSDSTPINNISSNSCYISPIRQSTGGTYPLYYNSNKEIFQNTSASSILIKKDIQTVHKDDILTDIQNIRIVDYRYIDENSTNDLRRGVIAEELSLIPSYIDCIKNVDEIIMNNTTYTNLPTVNYEKLCITTILAIKDLIGIVSDLQNRLTILEN